MNALKQEFLVSEYMTVCCTQEQFGSKDSLGNRLWRSAEVEVI